MVAETRSPGDQLQVAAQAAARRNMAFRASPTILTYVAFGLDKGNTECYIGTAGGFEMPEFRTGIVVAIAQRTQKCLPCHSALK